MGGFGSCNLISWSQNRCKINHTKMDVPLCPKWLVTKRKGFFAKGNVRITKYFMTLQDSISQCRVCRGASVYKPWSLVHTCQILDDIWLVCTTVGLTEPGRPAGFCWRGMTSKKVCWWAPDQGFYPMAKNADHSFLAGGHSLPALLGWKEKKNH